MVEEEKKVEDADVVMRAGSIEEHVSAEPPIPTTVKPVVSIKNLNFSYDAGKPNIVGLDCVIEPNSKLILVGANGAGEEERQRNRASRQCYMTFDIRTFLNLCIPFLYVHHPNHRTMLCQARAPCLGF